jgi:type I restriction enzyme S subunit
VNDLMTIWKTDKLRNLPIDFVDGDRSSKYPKRSEFVPEGIPFLNAESINEGYLNLSKANFITEEKFSSIKKGRLQGGDLILTTRGNGVGKAAYFSGKPSTGLINAQLLIIRPEQKHIFPRFLYYSFINPYFQGTLKNFVSGSAQPQLPIQSLREVELSYPPLPIQCKITAILSVYDDLIENNTRRIEILEEMARSLYREWFVNFRSETEKVENRTLNDICEFIVDCEHKTAPTQGTGYPSIRTPNIGRGRLLLDKVNRVSEETYKAWTKRAIPQKDDLILAREAPVGNVAIIPKNLQVCLGQRTVLIRPNISKVKPYYLLYLMLSDEIQNKLLSLSNGATVHHLNLKDIRNLGLPELHSILSQDKINTFLSNYYDLIFNLTRKIENLRQTRDLLLPKLILGEIDLENLDINTGKIAA